MIVYSVYVGSLTYQQRGHFHVSAKRCNMYRCNILAQQAGGVLLRSVVNQQFSYGNAAWRLCRNVQSRSPGLVLSIDAATCGYQLACISDIASLHRMM